MVWAFPRTETGAIPERNVITSRECASRLGKVSIFRKVRCTLHEVGKETAPDSDNSTFEWNTRTNAKWFKSMAFGSRST